MSIFLPIRGGDDAVELHLDALPNDVLLVVDILRGELCPLDLWLRIAIEYYKRGFENQFRTLLEEGCDEDVANFYKLCKSERIQIINALGVYHTRCAVESVQQSDRTSHFEQATKCFKTADQIDIRDTSTHVGKGLLHLAQGNLNRADIMFSSFLDTSPHNIPALLGKASVSYFMGKFQVALSYYVKILQTNPHVPSSIRLGIGMCALQLQENILARAAFERVLVMDPSSVEARLGLTVLDSRSNKLGQSIINSNLSYLERAFDIEPNNATVCQMLASHYFLKGDADSAIMLGNCAHQNAGSKSLRGSNAYTLARAHQWRGEFAEAAREFRNASMLCPGQSIFYFGVAQMKMREGDNASALLSLEKVHAKNPDQVEVVKLIGIAHSRENNTRQAESFLKQAKELNANDPDTLIELALILEKSDRTADLEEALRCYVALATLYKNEHDVPYQVCCNISVLAMKLDRLIEAHDWLLRAHSLATKQIGSTIGRSDFVHPSIQFNQALLLEKQGRIQEADTLYNTLLSAHSDYSECHLRLAQLSVRRGDIEVAIERLNNLTQKEPQNLNALCSLANIYMLNKQFDAAEKLYRVVLSASNNQDAYALLAIGNVHIRKSMLHKPLVKSNDSELKKFHTLLHQAGKYFASALSKNCHNMFAANALGAVLFYKKNFKQAMQVLLEVRDTSRFVAQVWINLAHLNARERQFSQAIKLYETCLKRLGHKAYAELYLYLARAHYLNGDMQTAKTIIAKAIRLVPVCGMYWYDLALSCEQDSVTVLQKTKTERFLPQVQTAVHDLHNAARIFTVISESKELLKSIDVTVVEKHKLFCSSGREKSCAHLAYAAESHILKQKQTDASSKALQEQERVIELQSIAMEAEQTRLRQEEAKQIEERNARLAQIMEEQRINARKRQQTNDDEDEQRNKKKRKGKQKQNRPGNDSDDADNDTLSPLNDDEDLDQNKLEPSVADVIFNDKRNDKLRKIADSLKSPPKPKRSLRRSRDDENVVGDQK